jgi:hypothetical protein
MVPSSIAWLHAADAADAVNGQQTTKSHESASKKVITIRIFLLCLFNRRNGWNLLPLYDQR